MIRQGLAFLADQFGLDLPRLWRAVAQGPGYLLQWRAFRKAYTGDLALRPCLHDRHADAGTAGGEYFVQDLYVARRIHALQPQTHVDIGSRVDGFVAHVASFRPVEVWDIRPLSSKVPGITFRQADASDPQSLPRNYCDSLSCLHALEHFGLGRYGDPIDPQAAERGFRNMAAALRMGGRLHVSVPVGRARVLFNSHRIFDPSQITQWAQTCGLELQSFATVLRNDTLVEHPDASAAFAQVGQQAYLLGIFCFLRVAVQPQLR